MREEVFGKVMMTENGVYEVYTMNYDNRTIGGYKCFPSHGEPNPYRTFRMEDVNVHNMRER